MSSAPILPRAAPRINGNWIVVRSPLGHAQLCEMGQIFSGHAPLLQGRGLSGAVQKITDPLLQLIRVGDPQDIQQELLPLQGRGVEAEYRWSCAAI